MPDVDKCSDGEGRTRSQLAVCEHAGVLLLPVCGPWLCNSMETKEI